jgi:hypothetical protein
VTTPTNADPVEVPATPEHHNAIVTWLQDHMHLIPNVHELALDANKARAIIPLIEEYLPKVVATAEGVDPALAPVLAPLVEEATHILDELAKF